MTHQWDEEFKNIVDNNLSELSHSVLSNELTVEQMVEGVMEISQAAVWLTMFIHAPEEEWAGKDRTEMAVLLESLQGAANNLVNFLSTCEGCEHCLIGECVDCNNLPDDEICPECLEFIQNLHQDDDNDTI